MRLNFYAANLQEKYKVPAVGVEHWSEINKPDVDQGIVNLGKKTYHRLSKLIAVSQPLAKRMEVLFNVEPIIIHNIVDVNYNAYSRLSSNSDLVRIVTVGRLSSPKKIDLIIQALSKPCFKTLNWELTIVGTGPLEKELKELNEKANLQIGFILWDRSLMMKFVKFFQKVIFLSLLLNMKRLVLYLLKLCLLDFRL
mgnify:CR=1 FL=1